MEKSRENWDELVTLAGFHQKPRLRDHLQAHSCHAADVIQHVNCWTEGLGSLAVVQRPPSVPSHVDLSIWQLTTLQLVSLEQAKGEDER